MNPHGTLSDILDRHGCLLLAQIITSLDEIFGALEVGVITNGNFEVAGAKMADVRNSAP